MLLIVIATPFARDFCHLTEIMDQIRTVLLLDDDATFVGEFRSMMEGSFNILSSESEAGALDILSHKKVDVILLELALSRGESGMETLKRIKESMPDFPVIILTAHPSVESAVEAMRLGAYHYISKAPKVEELKSLVEKALAERELKRDYELLREEVERVSGRIVGQSPVIQRVFESIQRVAMTDVTVLITGESGTGKELVAREIHANSKRSQRVFVTVNCASLVKDLIESELFGHQKGSFTGAASTKLGKFELADGGTIFLDEIAELDVHLQVKLLRALQEKEIDRIGGTSPIPVDVRVLAATNRELNAMTERGDFRQDLFYRLNVYPIHLPPLRDHKDDIPLLVEHFLERFGKSLNKPSISLDPRALEYMMQYNWPGNVRELENILQRGILISSSSSIEPEHLPREMVQGGLPIVDGQSLPDIEREARDGAARSVIMRTLERTGWNIKESALLLGVPEKTLYDKCSRLSIKLRRTVSAQQED
ncbi:MAG: sigma-54 dependent transcriptional regulator [Ignavibacteriales bacterium]|nr:sigma-54 dependent transcriptional regulator [Ignavibacteriales bacterium]